MEYGEKLKIIQELLIKGNPTEVSKREGLNLNTINQWRRRYQREALNDLLIELVAEVTELREWKSSYLAQTVAPFG